MSQPEIIKVVPSKTYRLDGYEGYVISAVSTGAFVAVLEGLVQTNLEAVNDDTQWVLIAPLEGQGVYPYAYTTPFVRIRVLSGTPVFHLQKFINFAVQNRMMTGGASLGADGLLLPSQRPLGRELELDRYARFKSGDDWQPAWAMMMADAQPGDSLTARAGRYTVRNTCTVSKPVYLNFNNVVLEARGPNFTPISSVPRPVFAAICTTGNGSFGDNPSFPSQGLTLNGVTPSVEYMDNAHLNLLDGSVGIYLNNLYYSQLKLGDVLGTHYGIYLASKKTGSAVRGTSHCTFHLGSVRAVRGIYIQPDGNGTGGGWATSNRFVKGAFSSPDFTKNNPLTAPEIAAAAGGDYAYRGRTVPSDHIAITVKGCAGGIGYCYSNVFIAPYIEGENLYAFEGAGLQRDNGIINQNIGGYELPENTRRGYTSLINLIPDATGTQQGMTFLGGILASQISYGTSAYTRSESSGFTGLEQSYDGLSSVLPPLQGDVKSGGREWFLAHHYAQNVYVVLGAAGAATNLDLSKYRRFQVNLGAGIAQAVNQLTLINPPTKLDYVIELLIQQDVGSTPVPNFLTGGLEYNGFPQPYKRDYGADRYFIFYKAGQTTGGQVLQGIAPGNGVKYGASLPLGGTYLSPPGVGFWNQTEKQSYVFDDNLFYPSTPGATLALKGTVKKAAALTAPAPSTGALTVGAAYSQAEVTAIYTRLEQVRLRLADLEAKLAAAGTL